MTDKAKGQGRLWAILQAHIDAQAYPPSRRQLALRLGVAPQTLNNWYNGLNAMPSREHLRAVADLTGEPWRVVLLAALVDAGYEPDTVLAAQPDPAEETG